MWRIDIRVGSLVAIGTFSHLHLLWGKLRQLAQAAEHFLQVGVGIYGSRIVQQRPEVLHGWRYAVDEVALAFKIATETISSQHLQYAEKDEQREPLVEVAFRGNFGVVLQRVVVFGNKLTAKLVGIACRCLP